MKISIRKKRIDFTETLKKSKICEKISHYFFKSSQKFSLKNSSVSQVPKNLKWKSMLVKRFVSAGNRGREFRFEETSVKKSHIAESIFKWRPLLFEAKNSDPRTPAS